MTILHAAFPDRICTVDGDEVTTVELSDVECLAADERATLVGTGEGLYRRIDHGTGHGTDDGFERVFEGHVTAVARGADEWWAGTEPSAVHRSAAGRDWERLPDLTTLPSADEWAFPPRPETHHVRWLAADPTRRGRWYVAIEAGALLRTDDGGATWRDRPDGARRDTHTLAAHADAPGRLYCAAGDGYAESTDGGDTWSYPQEGLAHRYCWSVAVDPADPDTVVVSAARGPGRAHSRPAESYVYRREDGGPWRVAMDGLPDPAGTFRPVLASGTTPGTLYLLSNHGLFRSADAGRTWTGRDALPAPVTGGGPPRGLAVV